MTEPPRQPWKQRLQGAAQRWAANRVQARIDRELHALESPQVRLAPLFGFGRHRAAQPTQVFRSLVQVNVYRRS